MVAVEFYKNLRDFLLFTSTTKITSHPQLETKTARVNNEGKINGCNRIL